MNMQAGVISNEDIVSIFRTISRHRKQGVLKISLGNIAYTILFQNGRIVDVVNDTEPKVVGIYKRLLQYGHGHLEKFESLDHKEISVGAFYLSCLESGYIEEATFKQAKLVYEMDILYSLRRLESGRFEFIPKMIQIDEEFGLNVSPGQLLLDFVELDSEEDRFDEVFKHDEDSIANIKLVSNEINGLEDTELAICEVLREFSLLNEVSEKVLLNEYVLKKSLLSLYDKNVIELEFVDVSQKHSTELDSAVSLIDEAASMLSSFEATKKEGESEHFRILSNSEAFESISKGDSSIEPLLDSDENYNNGNNQSKRVKSNNARSKGRSSFSIYGLILRFNYALISPSVVSKLSMVLSILFLVVVSYFAPILFNQWFEALSAFTMPEL
jgi:hypothetical protein